MKLKQLRISNFQSFGPKTTPIDFNSLTFLIGPNGAGKTAVLQALSRMFDISPNSRRIRKSDFHIPLDENEVPDERSLFIEADFTFPELEEDEIDDPATPPNFAHMRLEKEDGEIMVRFRLDANIDSSDEVEEGLTYVVKVDENNTPLVKSNVPRQDRNGIQIHYLPARRDPSDHISYTTTSIIGKLLRAAIWDMQREEVKEFTKQINDCLQGNEAVSSLSKYLSATWKAMHKGSFFADPEISFSESQIDSVLRHLSLSFGPGHNEGKADFSRLSDGQKSILYLSIVLANHRIGAAVLSGENTFFDVEKLRPPVFTMLAMEEPENSLSPHYLGRINAELKKFGSQVSGQAVIATHSPSMLKRAEPENIRYIRLSSKRRSLVAKIVMPETDTDAAKFVREGILAYPELYFSRLVILGEGDSEEIILPRILNTKGMAADEAAISIVPLGGRHVNHFWRLLRGLGIPHITLLDFDLARFNGGWGRIRYAAQQLRLYDEDCVLTDNNMIKLPKWDASSTPETEVRKKKWIEYLEGEAVFFSGPLDIDLLMMEAFPKAYGIADADKVEPDEPQITAVLGKSHRGDRQYTDDQRKLFPSYHKLFKLGSKPACHLGALSKLTAPSLKAKLPPVLGRLADMAKIKLGENPE